MKNKKILIIITALCCMLLMSACEKKQDGTGNTPSNTTASKTEKKSGENTVIDVFSELNVSFEGENGSGEVVCEYTGNNDFIKYDVEFKGDRNGRYKNGDTAVIKLDYSDLRAENANVFFKEKEKEYTVDGLWGVILSADGYDFSECNKALEESMFNKEATTAESNIRNFDVGNTFTTHYIDGQTDLSEWKILSADFEPICGKLEITSSNKASNEYTVFYKVTLLGEKIEDMLMLDPNSKYAVGDKKELYCIISEQTKNVFIEKDSNIVKTNLEAFTRADGSKFMSETRVHMYLEEVGYDNFDECYKIINSNISNHEIYDVEIQ